MTHQTTTDNTSKKPEPGREAPPWWRYAPQKEAEVIDWMPGRLVKLRAQLRAHYWRGLCQPLTDAVVSMLRKRLGPIEAQDAVTDQELADLLAPQYGFHRGAAGWHIPELLENLTHANAEAQRASDRGRRGAEGRWGSKPDA